MAGKKSETRSVTILVRYLIKQDCPKRGLHRGDIVFYVENEKGERYYTTLRVNKVHSCDCDGYQKSNGKRQCYHIKSCLTQHNARVASNVAKRSLTRFFEIVATFPVGCEVVEEQVVESPVFANRFEQEAYEQEQQRLASLAKLDQINQERHAWLDAEKKRKAMLRKQKKVA